LRKFFLFLVAVLLTASVFAQTPEKCAIKAVIQKSSQELVTSSEIGMEINIHQGSARG
jgi:hypothetical protein